MTYDGTDANDDGIVEADVDNESVNTDQGAIKSQPADYHLFDDDGTYRAVPQIDGLSEQSGSEAGTVINDAVATLSRGVTVKVAAGTFTFETYPTLSENDALLGAGGGTIFQASSSSPPAYFVFVEKDTVDWTVAGITFDANSQSLLGIRANRVSGGSVRENRFEGFSGDNAAVSIYKRGPNTDLHIGPEVVNNNFEDIPSGVAIDLAGEGPQYLLVNDNRIHDVRVGIRVTKANQTIGNNRISDAGEHGVKILSSSNDGKVVLAGNTINHIQGAIGTGVYIEDARLCTVVNNHVLVCDRHGIHLKGAHECNIRGNMIGAVSGETSGSYDAIFLEDFNEDCTGNKVADNYAQAYGTDARTGIKEASGVSGNQFADNESNAATRYDLNEPQNTVRIERAGSRQTISSGQLVLVSFDNEDHADSDRFSVDLTNDEVSVDEEGEYRITASVEWSGSTNWSSGDQIQLDINVNNSVVERRRHLHVGADARTSRSIESTQSLSAGDSISLEVYHNSGADEQINGKGESTNLEVEKVDGKS